MEKLLKCAYGDNHINYTCPGCRKQDSSRQKHEIVKLPQVLILHLKRFDVNNKGISKNQQYVDFPLEKLNIGENELLYKLSRITMEPWILDITPAFVSHVVMGTGINMMTVN